MRLSVDRAGAGDVAAMAAILSDWIDETDWMPRLHSREEDRAFVAGLLVSHDVRVVRAPLTVGFLARRGPEVEALYVARIARGMGVGSALIGVAKAETPILELWTFQANSHAVEFYSRLNFSIIEQSDGRNNAERLPDLRMRWEMGGSA